MKLPRRQFLHLAAGAAALPGIPCVAWAQPYPSRPVHIIVGFPGGSASDTTARLIGRWLSERLGQPFVIANRPGAASNLAAEAVAHAPPDGYTLLLVTSVNAINANLGFDFIRDIVPVARLALAGAAGRPISGRFFTGLRCEHVAGYRRANEYTSRYRRETQQGDQCRSCRSHDGSAD